jgi:O-acetyl-ADP-ribose deacetylase (regulator of RNase III)
LSEEQIDCVVKGNLITKALDGDFRLIVHGCNCFCTMGSGIAVDIKDTFPEAYEADKLTNHGDSNKLGTYSFHTYDPHPITKMPLTIINAYTQYYYGRGLQVDYQAIDDVFKHLGYMCANTNIHIGYPQIGAGLAGGDWDRISAIIDNNLKECLHTLVEYDGTPTNQMVSYD